MTINKLTVLLLLLGGVLQYARAQEVEQEETKKFSLKEAQEYAISNSYEITISNFKLKKAKQQVGETRATGLPQINGSVEYQNFLNLATQLIPAKFFDPNAPVDAMAEVQFGTKHNATVGITASQLLFSGSYIVALRASKAYMNMSKIDHQQTKAEINQQVHQAYVTVLVSQDALAVLDSIHVATKKNLREIQAMNKAGFLEETDVDQIELLLSNIESQRINARNQLKIARTLLNFRIGVDLNEQIELTNSLDDVLADFDMESYLAAEFALETNISYQAAKNQVRIMDLQLDYQRSTALPTLSAFLSQQWSANRNELNFASSDEKWFPTTLFGIQLTIPIFAGLQRHYRIQQAKVDHKVAEITLNQTSDLLRVNFATTKNLYNDNYLVYQNSKKDKTVAKRIYDRTLIKYTKGMSSSLDLLQVHNQYLEKESSYFIALQNFLSAKTDMDKLLTKFEEL